MDEVGDVLIRKPASAGMEDRSGVILQAHMDMVPEKAPDKVHDFETDPITAYVEEGWLRADGTTLGADDGIGVALIMTLLKDETIAHGPWKRSSPSTKRMASLAPTRSNPVSSKARC